MSANINKNKSQEPNPKSQMKSQEGVWGLVFENWSFILWSLVFGIFEDN
jgi:hypothetical protein